MGTTRCGRESRKGLLLAAPAKIAATDGVNTPNDLTTAANTWNAQIGGLGAASKYVTSVLMTPATGLITITYTAANVGVGAGQNRLTLTPWMRNTAAGQAYAAGLAAGVTGTVDWGCASVTNAAGNPGRNHGAGSGHAHGQVCAHRMQVSASLWDTRWSLLDEESGSAEFRAARFFS